MKLDFIKPGTTVEGTIKSVEVISRSGNSFLEINWFTQNQTIRESHFMTNYDEIVEAIGKIGLDINSDTDTWIGAPAKLLIESNNGYLNATIVGPAEALEQDGGAIDYSVQETETQADVAGLLED